MRKLGRPRKLTDKQAREVLALRKKGWMYHQIAERYLVTTMTIFNYCNRNTSE